MDGTVPIASHQQAAASGGDTTQICIHTTVLLTTSNYVEARVYQSSGGALNVENAAQYSPEVWLVKA